MREELKRDSLSVKITQMGYDVWGGGFFIINKSFPFSKDIQSFTLSFDDVDWLYSLMSEKRKEELCVKIR